MKKTKVLLTLVCAVLLVAASVMGTLAYLTSSAEVNNTFTVGNVTLGNDPEAGLDEALVNENGQPINNDNNVVALEEAPRVTANEYKLVPGHSYTKDPVVHVGDDSEDCFLFVKVVNEIAAIEAADNNIAAQMAAKGWSALGAGYDGIYVYIGTEEGASAPKVVTKSSDISVFDQFKIDASVTGTALEDYADKTIVVTAYAVQVDGFEGSTATNIWDTVFATTP